MYIGFYNKEAELQLGPYAIICIESDTIEISEHPQLKAATTIANRINNKWQYSMEDGSTVLFDSIYIGDEPDPYTDYL